MKKSVNFLPENKRNDLKQLVDLVRRNIKDVGMVILYGSYARNTHVDYDQRIEFGVPTMALVTPSSEPGSGLSVWNDTRVNVAQA